MSIFQTIKPRQNKAPWATEHHELRVQSTASVVHLGCTVSSCQSSVVTRSVLTAASLSWCAVMYSNESNAKCWLDPQALRSAGMWMSSPGPWCHKIASLPCNRPLLPGSWLSTQCHHGFRWICLTGAQTHQRISLSYTRRSTV